MSAVQQYRPRNTDEAINEMTVLRRLKDSQTNITIATKTTEEYRTGPIAWSDIGNIALSIGDETVVFPKNEIETWSYPQ